MSDLTGQFDPRESGKSLLGHVRRKIEDAHGPGAFTKMYLQDCGSCLPDEFISDDLLSDIREKFYWPAEAVCAELEREYGAKLFIGIYVDPSYDDKTSVLLTLGDDHVLLHYESKAWNFWWPNSGEMEQKLLQWHAEARERYRKFAADA
ncbi:MAG: hypothetical protein ACR2L2_16480 [Acidobacteriota bacterium]